VSDDQVTSTELPPDRVAEMIEAGGAELIDVRRDYEFEAGRLSGARNIEINHLPAEVASIPRNRPMVLCCRTGNRSGMAAQALREAGYDAYNLEGGVTAWAERGLPLEPEGARVVEPRPPSSDR
jgi:rhodanese-related sulfurtransferase